MATLSAERPLKQLAAKGCSEPEADSRKDDGFVGSTTYY